MRRCLLTLKEQTLLLCTLFIMNVDLMLILWAGCLEKTNSATGNYIIYNNIYYTHIINTYIFNILCWRSLLLVEINLLIDLIALLYLTKFQNYTDWFFFWLVLRHVNYDTSQLRTEAFNCLFWTTCLIFAQ